jgi:hypothetical protein
MKLTMQPIQTANFSTPYFQQYQNGCHETCKAETQYMQEPFMIPRTYVDHLPFISLPRNTAKC